jgi:hypothetical protein
LKYYKINVKYKLKRNEKWGHKELATFYEADGNTKNKAWVIFVKLPLNKMLIPSILYKFILR